MPRQEIRICDFGGQGIIMMGYIIGKCAALFEGKASTLNQSFGPEARGGACSAQVVIEDDQVDYPYIINPRMMIAMSQEAYDMYIDEVADDGIILIEKDLIKPRPPKPNQKLYAVPATKLAEQVGRKIVQNIVMIGFYAAVSKNSDPESIRKAVLASVPKGTEELNEKAFDAGLKYGLELLKEQEQANA